MAKHFRSRPKLRCVLILIPFPPWDSIPIVRWKTVKLTWNGSLKCHLCNRGRSYTMRALTYATNGVEPASRAPATSQRSIPPTPLGKNRANPTRSRRTDTWFSTRSVHGSLIVVTPGKLGKKRPGKSRETSRPPTTPRQTNLHRNRCFSNKFSTAPPRLPPIFNENPVCRAGTTFISRDHRTEYWFRENRGKWIDDSSAKKRRKKPTRVPKFSGNLGARASFGKRGAAFDE